MFQPEKGSGPGSARGLPEDGKGEGMDIAHMSSTQAALARAQSRDRK